jgi:hypothetical protein
MIQSSKAKTAHRQHGLIDDEWMKNFRLATPNPELQGAYIVSPSVYCNIDDFHGEHKERYRWLYSGNSERMSWIRNATHS